MRFTVDTNILVYAYEDDDPLKRRIAATILRAGLTADLILTIQAAAEFLNVVRRKRPRDMAHAADLLSQWVTLYSIAATDEQVLIQAARFSQLHKLQLWDSIIWQAARLAGCEFFLTEDLQDGLSLEGMTVVNPFDEGNIGLLAELLQPI